MSVEMKWALLTAAGALAVIMIICLASVGLA
ncbi:MULTISPECIES: cytochrome bd-I oxidase subunit CydH [Aeromonas]|uniref:YnhF family membrane protein n=1 Tax=Aeromonas sanarellii TaxID=633415 RepID=A0ABS4B7W4_9GAMM|nr:MULTISPECIES: YnhF family membrane protein [Aeromonas]MBP0603569.1 YnhF family membrane protein [Aeromonas sanarellii]MEB6606839.1 YnhF family membrane protein [Aeromonas sanarellii]QXC31584.1 YnhF family membrane protein [Aeromonas sp. FDAARGOS 1409]QXW29362.1 YnhF family membrane protein [Aeromonas sanarellii]WOX48641.1 YnhF family membrane protein [Aeromonas sp. XH]